MMELIDNRKLERVDEHQLDELFRTSQTRKACYLRIPRQFTRVWGAKFVKLF